MSVLIDTHAFLWYLSGNTQLTRVARAEIETRGAKNLVSVSSILEISIKHSLGKLQILGPFESLYDDLNNNGFKIIPIEFSELIHLNQLSFFHHDPFDRLIVSQALVRNCNIVSGDKIFDEYLRGTSLSRVW
ncbi:MAG: type II toxin-antitoxin system VapC family toxin [Chloroherpetonaceae bacterium]|nr:type II toxin-antitoxin system VapC family toxin [Chloroherpetonaceae bacterium]